MAAPSETVWGSIVKGSTDGRQGKLGIYTSVTNTNTQTTVNVQVWFWTIYSCDDNTNTLYYNVGANVTSATTSQGSVNIDHTVASGTGWNTSNQTRLLNKTYTYTRGTSATTYKVYAKLSNIDMLSGTVSANTSYTVPKLASYTVSYNANGGSGAPSSQTKWYGKTLTLSSTKPTRTGYSFQGWATSASGSVAYAAGGSYTVNSKVTLYAVWKANTYTVKYNANGGSGAPGNQTKTYGKTLTLSSTKPKLANHNFLGWATSASSTTVKYKAGASYTANANVTLYAVWELAYVKPTVKISSISYVTDDTTGNITGLAIAANWKCTYTPTAITLHWNSSSDSGSLDMADQGVSFTATGSLDVTITRTFDPEATYTFKLVVSDSGGENSTSKSLDSIPYTIDLLAGGKGVAFGKTAEVSGYADFGFEMCMNNNLRISGRDLDGNIVEAFQPVNNNGNTIIGWGNYKKEAGNTNLYGHDVHIGVSNIAEKGYFRPYRRQGDSLTLTINTAGYVTNAGKSVTFWIPISVPIIGSPKVTVVSGNGFILRQESTYTHGSTASSYTTPDSYEASITDFIGIRINAVFSDTTNVINNDAIGIVWNGTITFN